MNQEPKNTYEDWNRFVCANNGSFLQSYQWYEFQNAIGHPAWLVKANNSQAVVLRYDVGMGKNYLYVPYGPVLAKGADLSKLLVKIKALAKKQKSMFVKIEPAQDMKLEEYGFKKSAKAWQPDKTIVLNLSMSEEELLSQMHKKTRYSIRLAQKRGVQVQISDKEHDLALFLGLLEKTASRHEFHLHPRNFYIKMQAIMGHNMLKLYTAKYQGDMIAAILVCFFNNTAYYLHGASDYSQRQLMAPYLLQWQAIKDAKDQGMSMYDFWGIDEQKWPGVTRFKKRFNGQGKVYPGAYDLILAKLWYGIYNLVRRVR